MEMEKILKVMFQNMVIFFFSVTLFSVGDSGFEGEFISVHIWVRLLEHMFPLASISDCVDFPWLVFPEDFPIPRPSRVYIFMVTDFFIQRFNFIT